MLLLSMIIVFFQASYSLFVTDRSDLPRGPSITSEPEPAVFDLSGRSQQNYITLRCVANGYPPPVFRWFKEEYDSNRIKSKYLNPLADNRYTQTDGAITIFNPEQSTDRGKYHCEASNPYGTIISETVQLRFGFIGEFNQKRSQDTGKENWGKSLSCDPPQHHPTVNYYWTRNSFPNFVEQDRRVFVSHDGNLYFSTLEKIDTAKYSCNVKSIISATGRTGPFFQLRVEPGSSGQKLLFPNNFPKAFPEAPLDGQDVRLECVAYGYPVPSYNWTRLGHGKSLPKTSYTTSHNRVLMIPKVKVDDMGDYLCTAMSGTNTITKPVTLSIQALPVFTIPLADQILDRGSNLVWTCLAFGIPDVTYRWYKNGKLLDIYDLRPEDQNRYKIRDNILTIDSLVPESDEGMYQCQAFNQLGNRFSSGQLKVVSIKPSFEKHPLDTEMYTSVGSNTTIPCTPEAVPFPMFSWKRNGIPIGSGGRIKVLSNGYLQINSVDQNDEGQYTCVAQNDHGTDQTTGFLTVFPKPKIIENPRPKVVALVNDTAELPCKAHTDQSLDIAYIWLHNSLKINFTTMPQFSSGYELGYLQIRNITFAEAGEYICVVKTSVGKSYTKTELIVQGPPSSPGAVLADDITATSAKIHWSDGSDNGRRIWSYTIEGRTNHNQHWKILARDITNFLSDPSKSNRRSVVLKNVLSPWSSYEFRVSAINELGPSNPSNPSPQTSTDQERPFKIPSNVGGGGGKAGTLTITWDPLRPEDWNAPEIWYRIYYKIADSDNEFREKDLRSLGNIAKYTVNVGEENYFKEYKVKVRALNSIGPGPESNEVIIYSAESMPQIQPNQVKAQAFNSTALNVTWAPLDLIREKIRGRLIGYRIKYWKHNTDPQSDALTLLSRSLDPWSLIVALQPNTEYYVAVMAYNDAGSGPESEPFVARTYKAAPQLPPSSVFVKAIDNNRVLVTWRGVSIRSSDEEPIIGYKVKYWDADRSVASARTVYKGLDGGDLEAVISDLVPGKEYKLRVLAYSGGGEGKMSSPAWNFKVGEGSPSKYSTSSTHSVAYSLNYFCYLFLLRISFHFLFDS